MIDFNLVKNLKANIMITIKKLEDALKAMHRAAEPIKKEKEKFDKAFEKACDELEQPFKLLLERFYDQELTDKNGVPVKENNTITNGKNTYTVLSRGTQFFFGSILNNPSVEIFKNEAKKTRRLSKKELQAYWIAESK